MKYLWKLSEKIEDKIKRTRVFLVLNSVVWAMLLFIAVFIPAIILTDFARAAAYALCAAGYGVVLAGIYGGALYLYKNGI